MALFALSRPPGVKQPGEVTASACACKQDVQGDWWLVIDGQRTVRVHEEAVLGDIGGILEPYVGHALEQAEIAALESYVIAHRGQIIVVYDAFPQFFRDKARPYQQMVEEGEFPKLEDLTL